LQARPAAADMAPDVIPITTHTPFLAQIIQ